jgi:N6-adenosine-specific RNA methylase IME4
VRYSTIVIDPPWPHPDSGTRTLGPKKEAVFWGGNTVGKASVVPYRRMSVEEITALPVGDLAAQDAHLYLWTTNRFMRDAYAVAEAWGFKFSTILTWCKAPMGIGMGGAFTITNEYVLFCRRGSLKALSRFDRTWWNWKRPYKQNGAPSHSQKPEGFLDVVEQVSPEPRLEMFARRNRLGWDTWGDEAMNHIDLKEVVNE